MLVICLCSNLFRLLFFQTPEHLFPSHMPFLTLIFLLGSRKRLLSFFWPPFVAWKKTTLFAKLCTLSSALIFSFAQFFWICWCALVWRVFFFFAFWKQDLKRFRVAFSSLCGKIVWLQGVYLYLISFHRFKPPKAISCGFLLIVMFVLVVPCVWLLSICFHRF